jgi:hypothetical protein
MGFLDKIKGMIGSNKDKVVEGVDKATDVVDDKTGGKYEDQLEKVDEVVADKLDDDSGDDSES